ncbi:MAG: hypothetical protein IKN56_02945, partial [Clostridia bacterium]|nr:hypothetical protein [Clostridia bacterium]
SVILILALAAGLGIPYFLKPKEDNITVDTLAGSVYTQTHTVADYMSVYKKYAAEYFDGKINSYDSEDGLPDVCIPGLTGDRITVPQGASYFKAKDWFLISAYDPEGKMPSVIYALSGKTGELKAQFNLKANGKNYTGHVGGIGVSDYNLYLAGEGSKIGYIDLTLLYVQDGTVRDISIAGFADISDFTGGAATSYVTVTDGILCTGNFYHADEPYNKRAGKDYSSAVLSYPLSGDSSDSEWKDFKKNHKPEKYILPESVSKIQCAAVKGDKLYAVSSYGRRNDSKFYIFKAESKLDEKTAEVYTGMPMIEGFFIRNGSVNFITESASDKYNTRSYFFWKTSKNPTDVMWKFDYNKS